IYTNKDYTVIHNCTISNWGTGIHKDGSNWGITEYSSVTDNQRGLLMENSEGNWLESSILSENGVGISMSFSYRNIVRNNLFRNPKNAEAVMSQGNDWNGTRAIYSFPRIYSQGSYSGGNYWSGPSGGYSDNCADQNKDGFCDEPYIIDADNKDYLPLSNKYVPDTLPPYIRIDSPKNGEILESTTIPVTITAQDAVYYYTNISILQGEKVVAWAASYEGGTFSKDLKVSKGGYYNISATTYDYDGNSNTTGVTNVLTPIEMTSCGILDIDGETYYLKNDISHASGSICLNIKADNIVLDCRGKKITGKDATYTVYGISVNGRESVEIRNCTVTGWDYGIFVQSSKNGKIHGCQITQNREAGILMYSSTQNRIYNNYFSNQKNVVFQGDYLKNLWNTAKKQGNRIYSPGKMIGGNYWSGPGKGYSDKCDDLDTDGFCDDEYDLGLDESPPTGNFLRDILTGRFLEFLFITRQSEGVNTDELPLSNKYLPDTTPPVSNASATLPNGSSYEFGTWTRASQIKVTLKCDDGYGSGCRRTYYCIDTNNSCTPGYIYDDPVTINFLENETQILFLRFYSKDEEENNETVRSRSIYSPSLTQKLTVNNIPDLRYVNSSAINLSVTIVNNKEFSQLEAKVFNSTGNLTRTEKSLQNGTYNLSLILGPDGKYKIEVLYLDIYGFSSPEAFVSVQVDT
ncbi:MAG: NosD domain-containing protein, partial [Candidatus Aenigmatarchaeota archaeon]